MAEVIKMPKMSDTMTEGVIAAWHKKVGDKVKSGDVLADVETDKATMELESYEDGTLLYVGVKEGEAVVVDGILAIIGEKGTDFKPLLQAGAGASQKTERKSEPVKSEEVKKTEVQSASHESSDSRIKASP